MPLTTNYSWDKPTVGGDSGAWGTKLNTVIDNIDSQVKTVENTATAALPKAGGVMTGRADLKTSTMARVDKGSISGAQSLDVAAGQYFTLTVGGALSPSFTNVPAGSFTTGIMLRVTNGGAFTITWPASVKWPGGVAPTLTTSGVDIIALVTDDNGTTWRGWVAAKDVR